MNVVLHSVGNSLRLFLSDFGFGILAAFFFDFFRYLIAFIIGLPDRGVKRFGDYALRTDTVRSSGAVRATADILLCIVAASSLLFSAFIHNSGNFRILSVVVFVIGLMAGRLAVSKILAPILMRIFFAFKRATDLLFAPVILIASILFKTLSRLIGKIFKIFKNKYLRNYTSNRFNGINKDAEFGLLDEYYKEVIK